MKVLKTAATVRLVAVAVLMLVLLAVSQPTVAAPPVGLFTDSAARADPNVHPYPNGIVLRSRTVNVGFDMVSAASRAKGETLPLNLFADASYTAVMDRIDTSAQANVWVGHLDGVALSNVTLATVGNVMQGVVFMPNAIYAVRYSGNGVHTVYQINQAAFPPEAAPRTGHATAPNTAPRLPATTYNLFLPFILNNLSPTGAGPTIDVLVVYTQHAQNAAGGASAIVALIAGAESISNTSYANSGITQKIHIAGSALVNYVEANTGDDNTNWDTNLNNLTAGAGALSVVPGLRAQYKADLVDMLTDYTWLGTSSICGLAWLNATAPSGTSEGTGFSVVDQGCAVANLSFPHELGHNMGAEHDWYVDATNTFAHGYIYTPAKWRTIMAYNNFCRDQGFDCDRIPYWSNPAVMYGGVPMGVPDGTNRSCTTLNLSNPPCDADDHKMLNSTAATIAAFK